MDEMTDRERIARIIAPEYFDRKDSGVYLNGQCRAEIRIARQAADRLIAAGLTFPDKQ